MEPAPVQRAGSIGHEPACDAPTGQAMHTLRMCMTSHNTCALLGGPPEGWGHAHLEADCNHVHVPAQVPWADQLPQICARGGRPACTGALLRQ